MLYVTKFLVIFCGGKRKLIQDRQAGRKEKRQGEGRQAGVGQVMRSLVDRDTGG